MALPPLPESNTKRFWLVYTFGPYTHRLLFRATTDYPTTDARTLLHSVFDGSQAAFYSNCDFTGMEVAEEGSDIRNPVSGWVTISGSNAIGPASGRDLVVSCSARGRSVTGRKVKWLFFGMVPESSPDFQFVPTTGGVIEGIITFLGGQPDFALTIDGTKPVMKGDMLVDYNDHWEQEARP